jgi:bisphosphoglycerate-dependent phosphoglycerate mutase
LCAYEMAGEQECVYKVVLIRHGDSVYSVENRFCGWNDADIAEKGVQGAIKAAQVFLKLETPNNSSLKSIYSLQKIDSQRERLHV